MFVQNDGAGAPPDGSASAGTPDSTAVVESLDETSLASEGLDSGKTISDDTEPTSVETPPEADQEISADIKAEIEAVLEQDSNDSALVKKLRDLVKLKYEDYESRVKATQVPELSETQQQALELVKGLFEFDVETGKPTTRNFVQKIAEKDINLARQTFEDLSSIVIDQRGYTLGHKFLEEIGLDPYKIDELRQFSRGEIDATSRGIVTPHPKVPSEYIEAYKSLSEVTRTDVDVYLDSGNDAQVSAALQTLRNQQIAITEERSRAEATQRQQVQFNNEVAQATETDLESTYTGVLTALKSNPVYTNVTISSDPKVDSLVKDTLIAQLNALGDPRSVLAQQAVKTFEAQGVKVDIPKITSLMETIERASKTAIAADRMGKLQGRDYSTQIQEALGQKSSAVSQLIALGNRYFSEAMKSVSGVSVQNPSPQSAPPTIDGTAPGESQPSNKPKAFSDLDREIMEIAKSLQAAS